MRHYQVPCRLLDWTESPLVALFFALAGDEQPNQPAVWMLNPGRFNQVKQWADRPLTVDDLRLQHYAKDAFTKLDGHKNESVMNEWPMAVRGEENSLRMLMQSAVFTMQLKHNPLDECFSKGGDTRILHRVRIDRASRNELLATLETLGIDDYRLYPDLEYLAEELLDDALAYSERKSKRKRKRWNIAPGESDRSSESSGDGENTG